MKTEISRNGHSPEKRYSGVYQQQGRMITDHDWNAQTEIVNEQITNALCDIIGSGTPEKRPLKITVTGGDLFIVPGVMYIQGMMAQVLGDADVSYTDQIDFPKAPELPNGDYAVYADIWDRPVTALEELGEDGFDLLDPALHGADTTTRTQRVLQIKHCSTSLDPETDPINPQKGDAPLTLTITGSEATQDACDPCADEITLDARLGNYLFRLEIHDVKGDANDPDEITLKWSTENGAEQYKIGSEPSGFDVDSFVYEFFSIESEKYLGIHHVNSFEPARHDFALGTFQNGTEAFVRRWNGYCTLKKSGSGWSIENGQVGDDDSLDAFTIVSEQLILNLTPLEIKLGLDDRSFVAGDYWLAAIREDVHALDDVVLDQAMPAGICHYYCKLAEVRGGVVEITDDICKRWEFPPLTNIEAEDVCYDGSTCPNLFLQLATDGSPVLAADGTPLPARTVKEALDSLCLIDATDIEYAPECGYLKTAKTDDAGNEVAVGNVHEAIEALCSRDEGVQCSITLGEKGTFKNLKELIPHLINNEDVWVCLLPGTHILEEDLFIEARGTIKISGCSKSSSIINMSASELRMLAKEIIFEDLTFNVLREQGSIHLDAERITSERCCYERTNSVQDAQTLIRIGSIQNVRKIVLRWMDNEVNSTRLGTSVGDLITDVVIPNPAGVGTDFPTSALSKRFRDLEASFLTKDPARYANSLKLTSDFIHQNVVQKNLGKAWKLNPSEKLKVLDVFKTHSARLRVSPTTPFEMTPTFSTTLGSVKANVSGITNFIDLVDTRDITAEDLFVGLDQLMQTSERGNDAMALAHHQICGWIENNSIQGFLSLNTLMGDLFLNKEILDNEQRVEEYKAKLMEGVIDLGETLKIRGNDLYMIRTRITEQSAQTNPIPMYKSLFISDNQIVENDSSFVGSNVTMQGNQFLDAEKDEIAASIIANVSLFTNLMSEEANARLLLLKGTRFKIEASDLITVGL